jgi:hypothetical protein
VRSNIGLNARAILARTALMASFSIVTAHSASPSLSQLLISTLRPTSSICEAATFLVAKSSRTFSCAPTCK